MTWPTDKALFVHHLDESLQNLMRFTGRYCYNKLSNNIVFIVEPSGNEQYPDMDDFARKSLDRMLCYSNKKISKDILIDLLYVDGYVPNWINICVDESTSGKTVVRVLATREWRTFHSALKDLPEREIFHSTVSIPAGIMIDSENFKKYDVNLFRRQADLKSGSLWTRLRWFLRG